MHRENSVQLHCKLRTLQSIAELHRMICEKMSTGECDIILHEAIDNTRIKYTQEAEEEESATE